MIRLYQREEPEEQDVESHPWDLPPEAEQDNGWKAVEWQSYADDWVYELGPLTFDEIIAEDLENAARGSE